MNSSRNRRSVFIFCGLCALSVAGLSWLYFTRAQTISPAPAPPVVKAIDKAPTPAPVMPVESKEVRENPNLPSPSQTHPRRILFRWTRADEHYGMLAFVAGSAVGEPNFVDKMTCETIHFSGGKGSCLKAERGVFTRYSADIFDSAFKRLFSILLAGIPSRTRVSSDGKFAAVTVFVKGHTYASVDFTTQTILIETSTGNTLADLETFEVTKDQSVFQAVDFNFWGVTFAADNDRFYCTLSTNRKHYLLEGSVRSRKARVIHENVECPSLSPNGLSVAYKKRMPGDHVTWQLHVLDLKTMKETPLAEHRSVDDQIEWLDDHHVLYSLPQSQTTSSPTTDVWEASAEGRGTPRMLLPNAYSPSVDK